MKRILGITAAIILSSAAFIPAQALARPDVNIVIGNAPPPPRYEVVPDQRRGYEWAPGYWNWNGRRHTWIQGHWERVRPGHYYRAPTWERNGEGWRLNHGRWQRGDRDHDGIPNRRDRDRDGDGVPNRLDRRPDNPRRD